MYLNGATSHLNHAQAAAPKWLSTWSFLSSLLVLSFLFHGASPVYFLGFRRRPLLSHWFDLQPLDQARSFVFLQVVWWAVPVYCSLNWFPVLFS